MNVDTPVLTRSTKQPLQVLLNVIRGGLIAMAELVPGVSGGTIALVVGIYERALFAGNQLISTAKTAVTHPKLAAEKLREVDWWLLIPVGVGMILTVFGMAGVMHDFVEHHPEVSRALFMGMVAVSIIVPVRMADRADFKAKAIVAVPMMLLAAAVTFWGTGFTSAERQDPSLLIIFGAAAIAICALVLPGVSGSFFLLAVGLYAPVIGAIKDRDITVILVFALGAMTGIALFIRLLNYLLEHHRTVTLFTMAGLMLGSMRALWPWQSSDAALLAPADNAVKIFGFMALGAAIVALTIIAEKYAPAPGAKHE
ncbi:DUF368 domain-containing protein [Corynebacterium sp.]|uniref:DUF368 domain-containing protein n=1 Tax=Corynebacterium sp. TaxID=1720 RepID=UPI0026DC6CCE|nr:DUF368 domain-containing protein [Corynebacterium sp.]MDO5077955.1 DUF368 domain-containing protein [Corynebacterium sp.]